MAMNPLLVYVSGWNHHPEVLEFDQHANIEEFYLELNITSLDAADNEEQ